MINIIHRCMTNSEISHKKWDNHLALFHLKEFANAKEVYLNGKPLKWYHIFKKGDLIEVIDKPEGIFETIGLIVIGLIAAHPLVSAALVVGIIGATISGLTAAVSTNRSSSSTTQNKEYSSTTQPELRGASNDISNDIIPVVFGKILQTPSYAQTPYRLVQDGSSTNKYRQYFIPNYKNVVYSDFKLGETSINEYSIDYVDIDTVSGTDTFIGYENCKAISVDEELSYSSAEEVHQSSNHNYYENVVTTSLTYNYKLKFTNVELGQFKDKEFRTIINGYNEVEGTDEETGEPTTIFEDVTLVHDFTVNESNLTQNGDAYYYTGSYMWKAPADVTNLIDVIQSSQMQALTKTRNGSADVLNGLNVTLETESIETEDYQSGEIEINQSINYYSGTVSEVINTSPENCTEIDVILGFGQGLYSLNKQNGNRYSRSVTIEIMYKTKNGTWQDISSAQDIYIRDVNGVKQPLSSSTTKVSGNKVTVYSPKDLNVADQLFFRPIGFSIPSGQYSVRVRSADFAEKSNYDVGYPNCAEIQFRCIGDVVNPIVLPDVNQISFEATAYKGLSGTLKKFNYIAEAIIPVWNGKDWDNRRKTTNPAAIVRFLLTDNSVNPRAESLEHIDNETLVEYYNWCEEQEYQASGIVSEACKVGEIINQILQNSQCAMIPLYNGKHTFVMDKGDKIPIGLFNLHNSWNFKWTPNVGRQTEAIRASFVENDDWTEDELTLYWYNGAIHDEPEAGKTDLDYEMVKKDYKYVSDRASVRKIVAYELETIQTKRNTFEFDVNLEALNMMLLDRVYVSNTANMQNESTGLIKSVITDSEGNLTGFNLYSEVKIPDNAKIIIRSLDYENKRAVINTFDVINSKYDRNEDFIMIEPVPYNGVIRGAGDIQGIMDKWHYDGDLFTLGQDTIYDCTVTDIKYNDDGTATITARDYGFTK